MRMFDIPPQAAAPCSLTRALATRTLKKTHVATTTHHQEDAIPLKNASKGSVISYQRSCPQPELIAGQLDVSGGK